MLIAVIQESKKFNDSKKEVEHVGGELDNRDGMVYTYQICTLYTHYLSDSH